MLTTSIAPLANGNAPPATQTIVSNLRSAGLACDVDLALVEEIGAHFARIAQREGRPVGVPAEYDISHYEHQTAGGVMSNLVSQLREVGSEHRLREVLEECTRVRQDLGWPIIVTPFAQFVATQAAMNVLYGERYRVVPDEVKKYALGYFGRLPFPVNPDALDRIVENGSDYIPLEPPELEPAVPTLRSRYPGIPRRRTHAARPVPGRARSMRCWPPSPRIMPSVPTTRSWNWCARRSAGGGRDESM